MFTFLPLNLTLSILSLTVSYPIIAFPLDLSHMTATPFFLFSALPDIIILYPFQLKCPWPFHLVSLSPIIVNFSRFISLCMMFILPLCILRTFHLSIFIFCLQLRLSRCTLMQSASKHPFGFSPAASLDPAPDSLSRSFPVAVEPHFLGQNSFLGTLTGVVCHCLLLGVFHETPSLIH